MFNNNMLKLNILLTISFITAAQLLLSTFMSKIILPYEYTEVAGILENVIFYIQFFIINTPSITWLILISGIACYIGSFILWYNCLKSLPISIAYPLLSISYITVYIVDVIANSGNGIHTINYHHLLGIILIIIGIAILAKPRKKLDDRTNQVTEHK